MQCFPLKQVEGPISAAKMGRTYHVRSLTSDQLSQAFPLVQAIAPGILLGDWLDYARSFALERDERAGITTAQSNDGYIYGLFCHQVECDLRYRRKLTIENFVVLDLVDHRGAVDVLLGAIDVLAQLNECGYIRVTLPHTVISSDDTGSTVLRPLRESGHTIGGIFLCKRTNLSVK